MTHNRRVKIICTIGPASREPATLAAMLEQGMDVARLNFSHGTHAEHGEVVERLREVARAAGRPLAILQDLSGPKIRLGALPAARSIAVDEVVSLAAEGTAELVDLPVQYPSIAEELAVGDRLSLADGTIELQVTEKRGATVWARALSAGSVTSHKGVNLPTGGGSLSAVTAKDEHDLAFGLKAGVDWVALSFVRSPTDRERVDRVMQACDRRVPLLAKMEKPQALSESAAILAAFDGVMVARGDLGVEIPYEQVPFAQKRLVREANAAAKPVVVATQMLLSMVNQPRPTRAEVADVASAALDGADAVMLSEETTVGKHPVAAVAALVRVLAQVERERRTEHRQTPLGETGLAVAHAAWELAERAGARLLVTPTTSGASARRVAAMRPGATILALTAEAATAAELALTWGVVPRLAEPFGSTDELFARCRAEAKRLGLGAGDRVVVTAGLPIAVRGTTNLVHLLEL